MKRLDTRGRYRDFAYKWLNKTINTLESQFGATSAIVRRKGIVALKKVEALDGFDLQKCFGAP